jgi:predicted nucleic acid-binding protein
MTFLDTSAIYAWTDTSDPNHEEAKRRPGGAGR